MVEQDTSAIILINFSTWLPWVSQTKASCWVFLFFFSCDKSFSLIFALHECGVETNFFTSETNRKTLFLLLIWWNSIKLNGITTVFLLYNVDFYFEGNSKGRNIVINAETVFNWKYQVL